MSPLVTVAVMFTMLSLLALGGGTAIIPEMHLQAVKQYHWLTDRQFVDLYAITNVVPGPSSMIVCAIGYAGAGIPGAFVATIAMFLPSSLLTYFAASAWNKFRGTRAHLILGNALAPVAVGLMIAAGLVLAKAADHSMALKSITALVTLLVAFTRVNLLIIMACAALIGLALD